MIYVDFVLICSTVDLRLSPPSLGQGKPPSFLGGPAQDAFRPQLFTRGCEVQMQRPHCHSWTTAGEDLQLGSECKLLQSLAQAPGKTF